MAYQWLWRFRAELGLTQRELGSRAGLSQIRISLLERGIEEPSSTEADRIVKTLVKYAAAHEFKNFIFT